jgi:class 3 adenylate cyclase
MSTAPKRTLADLQQTIDDLHRQLAERTAERDEGLAREAAMAEVLGLINSSPGDLVPVFDAMLGRATKLCHAGFGILWTYDGQFFHATATYGVPGAYAEVLRTPVAVTDTHGLAGLVRGNPFLHATDLSVQEAYRRGIPATRAIVDLGGARSALVLALRNDHTMLGAFAIYRQEIRPFSDKEISLLKNFAAQAAIAMENARLLTETREALKQQTATAEVLQVINSAPGDLAPVFDTILTKAAELCEAIYGALFTFDGECFHPTAIHSDQQFADWLHQRSPILPQPGSPFERIAQGERFVHIADTEEDSIYQDSPGFRELAEIGSIRSHLAVALRRDDRLVGALVVFRREVRPFTDRQVALLLNFAAQAVIAMENARLIIETREALEQQTATAEVLQVINSSPGDLAPVFDAILEKAHALCGAEIGSLTIYDGEENHAVATRGLAPSLADRLRQGFRPGPAHPIRKLLSGARIVQVPDVGESADPIARASELAGIGTSLYVPLRNDDRLLGQIVASRQEVRPFSDKEIALLENFAAQAVIAMENARLLSELRQRTQEIAELNRSLEARVEAAVEELGRVGRLKRFLAPQLAEMIIAKGEESILESHRREIVVVFCDLRGYTAFTETAEPEDVLDFLREYHGALGPLVSQFEGTLDQFSGDGIMVFFNDPVPISDPAERAVRMATAMRDAASKLVAAWRRRHGSELGFGVGIAQGYATLGQIGFSERSGYTAIGTVCNLAARLCAAARDGQILLSTRIAGAAGAIAQLEALGNLELKGLSRPVAAFNVLELASSAVADAVPSTGRSPHGLI